ncbi:MAG: response regulator transcription factor [Chitinophagales bacterium]|nr:response regulator transcription factor [Chitinophagales bacterium]
MSMISMEEKPRVKIAIADDQELFLESMVALFRHFEAELEVLWVAQNSEAILENIRKARPDVLILDYFFRDKHLDGGMITELLLQDYPDLKVLILSVSTELTVIRDALQRGVLGYATKACSKTELLQAIQNVAAGAYFLDQVALREVLGSFLKKAPKSILTKRELEVALLYGKGRQIKEISSALFISEDTVESHVKNIRSKTDANSRYEVEAYLRKLGLWEA